MKTQILYFYLLFLTVLLVSCAGRTNEEVATVEEIRQIDECYFPDSPDDRAPLWICGAPIEGLALHAVGITEKSKAGFSYMRQLAATDARTILAQEMQVQLQNMVSSYVETTGQGDTETVDRVNSVVTKQVTSETLQGARVIRYLTSPNETLYVLIGMDEASVRNSARGAVSSSLRDDNAAWQQLRAQQGHEELAKAIADQPLR